MHCDVGCCRSGAMYVLAHLARYHGRMRCLAHTAGGDLEAILVQMQWVLRSKAASVARAARRTTPVARRSPLLRSSRQAGARHHPGARRLRHRPVAPWPDGYADVGGAVSRTRASVAWSAVGVSSWGRHAPWRPFRANGACAAIRPSHRGALKGCGRAAGQPASGIPVLGEGAMDSG
jgi:hypothetical protein